MKLLGEWYISALDDNRKSETSLATDVEILENGWLRYTLGGKVYLTNYAVMLRQPVGKKAEGAKEQDAVQR